MGFERRRESLLSSLPEAGMPPLTEAEHIVLLLPTRNVETWVWCLLGHSTDEVTDYKQRVRDENLRAVFKDRWVPTRQNEPPSLGRGRVEWGRIGP